ncbi:MAG TPA: nickel transporter [Casimicrobiaceae bacterium]|nr:nickel transporter [Casimicrobiaceae bacterium]
MDHLPASWTALCLLAFILGTRHGLDADHLATIDGLTRYNARSNPRLARRAGALFSLGHGSVVLLVALLAATVYRGWRTPDWLETTGAAVSVAFLFGLAAINVRAVLLTPHGHLVAPLGLKGRLLSRFVTVQRAWAVSAVGVLFALSFDTISQAAVFALAAARFGGVASALMIAALFVVGMLAVDGLNGMWISRLIGRADRTAAIASRVMALTVAGISFAVGLLTLSKIVAPALDAWADDHALAISCAVMVAVLACFTLAMLAARHRLALRG